MKNDINPESGSRCAGAFKINHYGGHLYGYTGDIADCVQEIQSFIEEVHPYDHTDAEMLKNMFQEIVIVEDDAEQESKEEAAPVIIVYDYSDVTEMDDIAEWYLEEEVA